MNVAADTCGVPPASDADSNAQQKTGISSADTTTTPADVTDGSVASVSKTIPGPSSSTSEVDGKSTAQVAATITSKSVAGNIADPVCGGSQYLKNLIV